MQSSTDYNFIIRVTLLSALIVVNTVYSTVDLGIAGGGILDGNRLKRNVDYAIKEESAVDSFVGNLRLDSEVDHALVPGVMISELSQLRFELYNDDGLFRLDPISGKLFVAKRLDRETLCPTRELNLQTSGVAYGMDSSVQSDYSMGQYYLADDPTNIGVAGSGGACTIDLTVFISPSHWINVAVSIQDINDHTPKFPRSSSIEDGVPVTIVQITEAVNPGDQVPLSVATDADTGQNDIQSYSLRGAELDPTLFTVKYVAPYSLNLIILGKLDAEKQNSYTGELEACDGGQPRPRCGTQRIRILVNDTNDNNPVFSEPVYRFYVDESASVGSVVGRIQATDIDSGKFGHVTYAFGQTHDTAVARHFAIRPDSGEIYVRSHLNAKAKPLFRIAVVAKDGGELPRVGQATVIIDVNDTNDHRPWVQVKPMFRDPELVDKNQEALEKGETLSISGVTVSSMPEYLTARYGPNVKLLIGENQPVGSNVGLVISGDDDVGKNSEVKCILSSDDFALEKSNVVKDKVIYSLLTKRIFDRETISTGRLTVRIQCTDNGTPQLSIEEVFDVAVTDENEFPPEFPPESLNLHLEVVEAQSVGSTVLHIKAHDRDATANLSYFISQEAEHFFHMDRASGVLTNRVPLDRETDTQIRFQIIATDQKIEDESNAQTLLLNLERHVTRAQVTIELCDINDNAPSLGDQKIFRAAENRPGYADLIGQVTAIDPDAGNNGSVQFFIQSIRSGNELVDNGTFILKPNSGQLYAQKSLDREKYAVYSLSIRLEDQGSPVPLKTFEEIIVEVIDENDNAPEWTAPEIFGLQIVYDSQDVTQLAKKIEKNLNAGSSVNEYGVVNVTSTLHPGQRIMILNAKDRDAESNANITYHILSVRYFAMNEDGEIGTLKSDSKGPPLNQLGRREPTHESVLFDMNPLTGDLQVGAGPEGSGITISGVYELLIRASDNGNPPLISDARLLLRYNPEDDNVYGHYSSAGSSGLLSSKWGLFSPGRISLTLVVILIGIICLVSICLLFVVIFARRRTTSDHRSHEHRNGGMSVVRTNGVYIGNGFNGQGLGNYGVTNTGAMVIPSGGVEIPATFLDNLDIKKWSEEQRLHQNLDSEQSQQQQQHLFFSPCGSIISGDGGIVGNGTPQFAVPLMQNINGIATTDDYMIDSARLLKAQTYLSGGNQTSDSLADDSATGSMSGVGYTMHGVNMASGSPTVITSRPAMTSVSGPGYTINDYLAAPTPTDGYLTLATDRGSGISVSQAMPTANITASPGQMMAFPPDEYAFKTAILRNTHQVGFIEKELTSQSSGLGSGKATPVKCRPSVSQEDSPAYQRQLYQQLHPNQQLCENSQAMYNSNSTSFVGRYPAC